ncbi:enoyl-CoA hydratase [Saccharomonospora piscinae]|uniref:Enoyl-CoA hydratase n=1 Tax=Saccharomonospora piscinae TaxID=687388 RepID=A0A1V9A4U6_SACPI|nr:enoyl-CoA hydratase-related protein [Saccharomonospora piscinae]OQO92155.1 enoyl-CoA hydratase [Saccharomonospora piscinae]
MPALHHHDPVFVLEFGDDENRFSPEWLTSVHTMLDTVCEHDGPSALVTTGLGKFYSNGLDLAWLSANAERTQQYVGEVHALLGRMLTLPVPTVAAVNGHAFGAGAMLAMAHDFRVMRTDRGFFCFPEADINIPFTPGMAALIQGKLTPAAAVASMTTGRRFGGPEAVELGLVDAVAPADDLVDVATARVRELAGKDRGTLGAIKSTMFTAAVAALEMPTS